ncbi:MAG: FAD-binding protein, partial [Bacteroidaceae bacterium]|nr:FAD-binding protein [Bacteroidaceae bacterium]
MKLKIKENHPIFNTFHIEARAARYAEYASVEELQSLIPELAHQTVLHVGGGSNLLFLKDFDGIVLHSAIRSIDLVEEDEKSVIVRVGAGIVWDDFVAYTIQQGWSGAENLSLIPGEVGASAVQNIGAYGAEAKDIIVQVEAVELLTGKIRKFENAECNYAYRQSIFKQELRGKYAITHVSYRLSKQFEP